MKTFKDIEAVEEWLAPMDYEGFWFAVTPYNLALQDKADCDAQLAAGGVTVDVMLNVLKGFARIELTAAQKLKHRELTPWVQLVSNH